MNGKEFEAAMKRLDLSQRRLAEHWCIDRATLAARCNAAIVDPLYEDAILGLLARKAARFLVDAVGPVSQNNDNLPNEQRNTLDMEGPVNHNGVEWLHGAANKQNKRSFTMIRDDIQMNDPLVEIKALILKFMRERKMEVGHVIPTKPFQFQFYMNLNPKQQQQVEPALMALVAEKVLDNTDGKYRLTDNGFNKLY